MIKKLCSILKPIDKLLDIVGQPLLLLAARLWVAKVFFMAGLTKVKTWSSTLALFEYEYSVPLLPPVLAAYSGTFVELFFPILLALGLCGRWSAIILFVFNIVAVISYWEGIAEYPINLQLHIFWGALLAMVAVFGPGKLSLDNLLGKKFCN